jgi:C1A family cysteine protease
MLKIAHRADGTVRNVHLGGWRKQHTDMRDETYKLKLHGAFTKNPASCDNRPVCSTVEDQGDLGSCTANMFAALVESNEIRGAGKSGLHAAPVPTVTTSAVQVDANGAVSFLTTVRTTTAPVPAPPAPAPPAPKLVQVSRLFEYYATRRIEGTVGEDSGATIRDAIKAGVKYGVADEAAYPYDVSKFTQNPPAGIWTQASTHKVTSYHAVSDGDVETMKSVLASGYLVGFGFQVYDYFMSADMAKKGVLPVPGPGESLQGGHAVCLAGYDDARKAFLVRNSWGANWGAVGYFWMAYDYVANPRLCSDFWVVQSSPV